MTPNSAPPPPDPTPDPSPERAGAAPPPGSAVAQPPAPPAEPSARPAWRQRLAAERRVTPEVLNVDPALVGRPLGRPARRAVALGLDLLLVAALASASGFWLLGGLALVLLQLRFGAHAEQGLPARLAAPLRWLRSRPGAGWALALAFLVLAVWNARPSGPGGDEAEDDPPPAARSSAEAQGPRPRDASAAVAQLDAALAQGPQPAFVRAALEKAREEALRHAAPPLAEDAASAAGSPASGASGASAAAASEVDHLRQRIRRLEAQLADAHERKPLKARLKAVWDEMLDSVGVSFGWGFVYFSLLPAWWGGQTVGKKLLGLRTVELTGQPLTVMRALKRYGGYVAALGTGGIGFLQILWDPNAQGLHDKAAHTVVLDLRAAAAPAEPPRPA